MLDHIGAQVQVAPCFEMCCRCNVWNVLDRFVRSAVVELSFFFVLMRSCTTAWTLWYCWLHQHFVLCWLMLFKGWKERVFSFPFPFYFYCHFFFFFACTDRRFNRIWTSSGAAPWMTLKRPPNSRTVVVYTSFCWTETWVLFKRSFVKRQCPVRSFKPFLDFSAPSFRLRRTYVVTSAFREHRSSQFCIPGIYSSCITQVRFASRHFECWTHKTGEGHCLRHFPEFGSMQAA